MRKVEGAFDTKIVDSLPGRKLDTANGRPLVVVGLREPDGDLVLSFMEGKTTKRWRSPAARLIRQTRIARGLTQKEAGAACMSALRSWQDWEYGKRRMHPAIWQVFLHATAPGQAAACELAGTKRSKSSVRQGRAPRAHRIARA